MTDCLNCQTRDMDFYVGDFDADKIDVEVSRNLEDRSAWYFKCKPLSAESMEPLKQRPANNSD